LRGIFLSLVLIAAFSIAPIPFMAYAENEIIVESVYFEKGTIIEFINQGNVKVDSFRIWLSSDFVFESFKTEEGWVGDKTPEGVIIFSSNSPLDKGSSVKFGVKTNDPRPGINWKALDKNEGQISIGKSIPSNFGDQVSVSSNTSTINGIFENSFFRIIPEKPNAGGTIRVTGENFGASQEFEFFINTKKLGSFFTDDKGYFITTFQIPENQISERVDFSIKDKTGDAKNVSLILGNNGTNIPSGEIVKLTIKGIPDTMYRGDFLEISGTAQPGSAITASIKGPNNEIINTRTAEVTAKGLWKLAEPIIVPLDTPFGKYTAEIFDGRESIVKMWTVESSKVIVIAPNYLKFNPGETLAYNGTALPNLPIELILKDPLGKDIISDIFELDDTGIVEFEYKTTANVDKEGTWTLIATQGGNKEYIYAGLGELPTIPINVEFNKLNYKTTEPVKISFKGKPSEVINLLIIDPSDKPKGDAIPIALKADGTQTYTLDITGYSSGIYSAIVSKGTAKSTAVFTIGLQTGSGEIDIGTTKDDYQPGDPILILGKTKPNVLLTLTLIDSNGKEVKQERAVSDKNGQITENTFRIPSEAEHGTWKITAQSGSNFDSTEFDVNAVTTEGLQIIVQKSDPLPLGKVLTIKVIGAQQTIKLTIFSDRGELIQEFTPFPASKEGQLIQPWLIPNDLEPGKYVFKVKDAYDDAETTFEIK
jgi:hypothetical protein